MKREVGKRRNVIDHYKRMTFAEIAVFDVLILTANESTGVSSIPRKKLAGIFNCSVNTVVTALKGLAEMRYIERHQDGWRVFNYDGLSPVPHPPRRTQRKQDHEVGPQQIPLEMRHPVTTKKDLTKNKNKDLNKRDPGLISNSSTKEATSLCGTEQKLIPKDQNLIPPVPRVLHSYAISRGVEKALWIDGLIINKHWLSEQMNAFYAEVDPLAPEVAHIKLNGPMYRRAYQKLAHELSIYPERRAVSDSTPAKKRGFANRVSRYFKKWVMNERYKLYQSSAERVDQSVADKLKRAKILRDRVKRLGG